MRHVLNRFRRSLLVVVFAGVAAFAVIPAGTASAASGCSGGTSVLFGAVMGSCQTGSYAVAGFCKNWLGYQAYVQGPRTSGGRTSIAYCPSGYWPTSGWMLTYS